MLKALRGECDYYFLNNRLLSANRLEKRKKISKFEVIEVNVRLIVIVNWFAHVFWAKDLDLCVENQLVE